jgi:hypothetical protein
MFFFIGELIPKELLNNADFALNVGNFTVKIEGNRISCITDSTYEESFDREIREPAIRAMNCVPIAQAVVTLRQLSIDLVTWIEIKLPTGDIFNKVVLGHFLSPSGLPINNQSFLSDFGFGLRYANQAFTEVTFKVALEDFSRAIGSAWDECIYHCQHCLEAVRDYFGKEKRGWEVMRQKLKLEETELKVITDFSAVYVRHGSAREQLQNLTAQDKSSKAQDSLKVCQKVIASFSKYLNAYGCHSSLVHERGMLRYSFLDEELGP